MIEFSKLFIDTTPLIYYVEKNPEYYDILKKFFMESFNAEKDAWQIWHQRWHQRENNLKYFRIEVFTKQRKINTLLTVRKVINIIE